MTAPDPAGKPAQALPNLVAEVGIDVSDPANPMVILRMSNAGITVDFKIEAAKAASFGAQVGQGMIAAAQQALASAAPRIVTPNLLIARPGTVPPNGAGR